MMSTTSPASLPYHEPNITTILTHSSFLLLLNIFNSILDNTLYCGLLGQVFVGVAWGTPGGQWLGTQVEHVVVQLGYLGLLLLVYEGGLSTSFCSLKSNLPLSSGVAITGIALPIALSFILTRLTDATPLQCFAAGAALCSTSLGTTFTVLGTSGLTTSRLGVVLTSAAMMDDVVGLVMVQVISNLGQANRTFNAVTVVRPLLTSVAFAVVAPLVCIFIARPLTLRLNERRQKCAKSRLSKVLQRPEVAFTVHTLILLGCVTGATYAGTSNLFAAYIAGASISWWDSEVSHLGDAASPELSTPVRSGISSGAGEGDTRPPATPETGQSPPARSGLAVYERYFAAPVSRILRPFFFASVGFSIPITDMFSGHIVWKGLVYTVLMILGKVACGAWLVSWRFPFLGRAKLLFLQLLKSGRTRCWGNPWKTTLSPAQPSNGRAVTEADTTGMHETAPETPATPTKPRSLYPATIISCAMTARGEIGFLISSLAESNGVFVSDADAMSTSSKPSDIFLVVTWAIVLCTILGPLAVGLTVQRVKRLQRGAEGRVRWDVLGVWGVA